MRDVRCFGVIGTGVIGAGWAARALARGLDVVAWDPATGAEQRLRAHINNAWPALTKLGLNRGAERNRLDFSSDLEVVCARADFIQESAPENEELKRGLHARISAAAPADVIVASSSSGLLPSRIQSDSRHPQRVLIGHPFNPVYILPLVEVLGGKLTDAGCIEDAMDFYRGLGMHPLHVKTEIEGYISDRLQEALWREALHMVADGVASTGEIDDAIIYGPGLRWAFMGTCLTFHLAGGEAGMRHMLEQFGPALKLPWTKLQAPELTDALIDSMVAGTRAQAGDRSIAELERLRDECLIGIMRTLRPFGIGAGNTIAEDEQRRFSGGEYARWKSGDAVDAPLSLYRCVVQADWVDYNGHMGESFYLYAFGWASDALFRYVGIDEVYRASGRSFHTVESHINYYREASLGEPLRFTTQVLDMDEKRLHLFHAMYRGDSDELVCSTEQMLLHVDMTVSAASPMADEVHAALAAIMAAHRDLPHPEQMGRRMAISKKSTA
ncbi:MAG: L-carnitine dehydrogenase [Lysobacterales bacterium]|nr:MAG: L-carnitine dehydrogenase [Xanthomonadales bacterium]